MYVRAPAVRIAGCLFLALAGCVAALGSAAPGAAPPAPAPTYVLPFAGTPDASPQTQVDFGSVAPSRLLAVSVTGSRSGTHTGRIKQMPGGAGSAFFPAQPFAPGEHVSVVAKVKGSGGRGDQTVGTSFTTAALVAPSAGPASASKPRAAAVHAALSPEAKTQSFYSEPWLHPPILLRSGNVPDPGQGDILVDAENSIQAGPLIYDTAGQLVWFDPVPHSAAFNVEEQRLYGQSALTFWRGYVVNGYGIGTDMVLNHAYQTVATINAANGYNTDLHEFQITPQGNALVTAWALVHADLRSVGGSKNGTLVDSVVEEINIATGQLLWEWHADGHVRLTASYFGKATSKPYDFFHANSIQQLPNGNFLVSARSTSAVYEISAATGRIVWILGGRHSSFKMGKGTNFEWQHDARLQSDGTLTVFDDGADGKGPGNESRSRALRIRINLRTHRATLVHAYVNHPSILAQSQGNVQRLPDGNTFVGWGSAQYFSEFDRRARQRFSGHFYAPIYSYRAYRAPWYGEPTGAPSVAASATRSGTSVYASWNGATDVAAWQLLAGPTPNPLAAVGQSPFNGFETDITTSSTEPYFAVQALSATGQVLGTSAVVGR